MQYYFTPCNAETSNSKFKIKICEKQNNSQHFQNFEFLIGENRPGIPYYPLKLSFLAAQRSKVAIAGASMPPMGCDLDHPSLTSGGQTVTLGKKLTDVLSLSLLTSFRMPFVPPL